MKRVQGKYEWVSGFKHRCEPVLAKGKKREG